MTNETIPTDELILDEYLVDLLNNYKQEFREYFYDKCRETINYFANCPVTIEIRQWFFHAGNVAKFPLSAQDLFDNVKGLSRMTGMSFIKQFNLANRLKHSSRWIRNITSKLKTIALLFSRKTNKINYCITFDLAKPVSEFFDTLVSLVFDYYSNDSNSLDTVNNSGNNATFNSSAEPSSQSSSEPSAGSKPEFSLVNLLYTKLCDRSKRLEYLLSSVNKNKTKSKEGMLASTQSQPASQIHSTVNLTDKKREETTTNSDLKGNSNNNNNNNKEVPKSLYNYKLCERYTIEYAKFKVGSPDEIRTIEGFATYCYNSGEKDADIEFFVKNDYVYIPYNSLKNNKVKQETSKTSKPNSKKKNQSKQAKQAKQTNETNERRQTNQVLDENSVKANDSNEIDNLNNVDSVDNMDDGDDVIIASEQITEVSPSEDTLYSTASSTNQASDGQIDHQNQVTEEKQTTQANQFNQQTELQQNEQTNQKVKPKGKYSFNIYLDFMERVESPRLESLGRKVYSAVKLAESAMNTGNDDKRVAKFVEQMKTASIGARPSDFRVNSFTSTRNSDNPSRASKASNEPTQEEKAVLAEIKQEFDYQTKFENLKDTLWQKLSASQQQSLFMQELNKLQQSKHFDSHYKSWSTNRLGDYVSNQVKKQLAKKAMVEQPSQFREFTEFKQVSYL